MASNAARLGELRAVTLFRLITRTSKPTIPAAHVGFLVTTVSLLDWWTIAAGTRSGTIGRTLPCCWEPRMASFSLRGASMNSDDRHDGGVL
jgi:hypothetical protein